MEPMGFLALGLARHDDDGDGGGRDPELHFPVGKLMLSLLPAIAVALVSWGVMKTKNEEFDRALTKQEVVEDGLQLRINALERRADVHQNKIDNLESMCPAVPYRGNR